MISSPLLFYGCRQRGKEGKGGRGLAELQIGGCRGHSGRKPHVGRPVKRVGARAHAGARLGLTSVSHLFVHRRYLTDFHHRSGALCRAMPDVTTVLGSPQLGCEEDLHTFDRSPVLCAHPAKRPSESPSDAAGLLMLLSAAPDAGKEDNAPQAALKAGAPGQLLSTLGWQPPQPQHQQQDGEARPVPKRAAVKVDRVLRCGACEGCRRGDCGRCPNCRDKPKFGGAGVKKQACNHRRCLQPTRTGMGHREALRNAMAAAADADSDVSEAASHDSTVSFYGSPPACARRDTADAATLPPVDEHQGWDEHKLPPAAATSKMAHGNAELMAAAAGSSSSENGPSRPSPGLLRETAGLQLVGKQARRDPATPQPFFSALASFSAVAPCLAERIGRPRVRGPCPAGALRQRREHR